MEKFIERLKDLLYDSIDYLIMIGIVIIVILILAWRLDLLFPENIEDLASGNNIVTEESENPENGEESKEENSGEVLTIEIPKGSSSFDIEEILETKGLISNDSDFTSTVDEMDVTNELIAGEFEIESGSSIETIIDILIK